MSNCVLKVQNLGSKSRNKYVYKDLNFEISNGEIVGLLGHNGAGKSTMQRVISNMEIPQYGKVFIDNKENNINKKNKDVVLIPDEIELFKNLSIKENLKLLKDTYGYDKEFYKTYLRRVKLTDDMIIKELSKGNQEIVQLIILMSLNTKVLLLDEPFSAVDIFRRELIQKMIIDLISKNNEKVIIITTHLIAEIQNILSRVIYLDKGKIVIDKEIEEIQEEKDLIDYLKDYFREDVGYETD